MKKTRIFSLIALVLAMLMVFAACAPAATDNKSNDSEQTTPSLSQAQRMKKLRQSGELNEDTMLSIMMEQKKPEKNDITLSGEKLRKYFPRSYTPFQIENTIFKLLDAWQKKRQRDQSR